MSINLKESLAQLKMITEQLEAGEVLTNTNLDVLIDKGVRMRDGVLKWTQENPELRENTIASLTLTLADKSLAPEIVVVLTTVRAGLLWISGDDESLKEGIDKVLSIDPAYSLALLMDIAIRHNVSSKVWESSLNDVSLNACLKGAV